MVHKKCVVCGEKFYHKRSTAKYCSNKCKQAAKNNRTKSRIREISLKVRTEMLIRELAANDPDTFPYIAALVNELSASGNGRLWACRKCGQNWFGDHPPEKCDFCNPKTGRSYWNAVNP